MAEELPSRAKFGLGSARPYPRISHISRAHGDSCRRSIGIASSLVGAIALQAGTRCRLAANEVEPAEQETDSSKFEISSQQAANSTTKHMPMRGLRGRFNPVAAAALCAVLVVPG